MPVASIIRGTAPIIDPPIFATVIVAATIRLPDNHWRWGYHDGRLINHRATIINGRRARWRRITDDLRRAIDDRRRSWRHHHWPGVRETRPDRDVD
jgi:hypothetical protein